MKRERDIRNYLPLQLSLFGLVWVLLALFGQHVSAQNYSEYNWLFGNSPELITFNKSDTQAQLDDFQVVPYGIGGGVVISDPVTADLLFYTDGERIYDANHNPLPGNPLLNGNPSINRAAVVFPLPYSTGQYYIFTNSGDAGVNEIQYTIVDRTLAGNAAAGEPAMGDIVSTNTSTGLTDPSEAMIVIRQDIDNYWLITQDRISLEIRVTALNSGTGVGTTTNFAIGTASNPAYEVASFAYDEANGRIALAPREANRNVYILDFDLTTGVLAFDRSILNTGNPDAAGESVYDVEWSASGNQLYISRFGDSGEFGDLYQFDFNDTIATVNSVLFQPVFRSYGIQRGPDQNIYHLYQQTSGDAFEIGIITEADSTYHEDSVGFNVGYDSLAFDPSNIGGRQFPVFPGPHFEEFDTVSFLYLDTCTSQTTKFFSVVEPTPESYLWDFGGDTLTGPAPVYEFTAAGSYPITLTVTLNGIEETYSQIVTINEMDLIIDLGMDTVRCPGEVFTYDAGAGALSYAWNTGETTQTIDVDTTGIFSVAIETPAGCRNYGYVQVVTYEDESQFRNQWYFGEQAGIDFNDPDGTVAITDANLMNSPQASSSVSDLNGDLLFYTNGVTVWNKEHQIMLNGSNIGGDSTSMQGAMIVPLPGDTTTYYIFTSDPVYGDNTYNMRYTVVDMKQDLMRGSVVQKNLPFFTNSTERMTALGLGQGITWLITHEFGNNQFKSYPLTPAGIGDPVTSAAGSVLRLDEEKMATAELQVAQAGQYIAMAIQDSTDNFVELFEIDSVRGGVTQIAKIDIQEPAPSLIYGVEFSSGAEKLYISTNSNGSKLLQYDMDSIQAPTAEADIEATKFEMASSAGLEYGALQTGADGIIYMAVDGQTTIGTINNPASDDASASFVEDGFDLEGRTSRLGLPNFAQTVPLTAMSPGASITNACLGQESIFDGSGTSIIDTYLWTFDDGTSAAVEDTTHTYNLPGTYNVSLRVTNRCGLDTTFIEPVDVFAIPSAPTVVDAVTVCNGPVTLEAWPVDTAAFSYTWSTGDTTRQITVSQASLVSVFITDTTGCQSEPRETFVDDTSPIVDLGPDQFVCQGTAFGPLEANNPGSSFTWTLDGTDTGTSISQQTVDTSVPGIYVYEVEVVDIFDCSTTDDIELTIQNAPNYTFTTTPTTGCGATDGAINIDITDTGSFTYALTGPVSVLTTGITGPSGDTQISNSLSGGGYAINVTNTVTGCANVQQANVQDGGTFTLTANGIPGCPGEGQLQVTVNAPISAAVDYELFDQGGNSIVSSTATLDASNQFLITNLDSGTYNLVTQGTDGFGNVCTGTLDGIVLDGNDLADFTVEPQFICGDEGQVGILPVTVNAADPILYTWAGPDIIGSAQGDSVVVGSAGTYTVTSSGTGYCDFTQDVIVNQNDLPEVTIDVQGQECDGNLTLVANVTSSLVGNAAYQWDNGSLTAQRTIQSSGTYELTVLDQGTGCTNTVSADVDVFDELTVFLAADPNCDDNSEVFLSAFSNITEDVTFSWTDFSGAPLSATGAEISISEGGSYNVLVVSDLSGCEANASIDVAVIPIDPDELLLPENERFCSQDPDPANSQVDLDPGFFTTYIWTILNDDDVLGTSRIYTATSPGVYEVTVSNGFTCIRDYVEVSDNCKPIIYAPNAFAPNGTNSTFFVYPNDYVTDFEIKIYSRWGELVYYSTDLDFRWDGYYQGELLQQGTYAYVMTFESSLQPERGKVQQRGGVLLLR